MFSENADYVDQIEKIAQVIVEHYNDLDRAGYDLSGACENFTLPSEDNVTIWRRAPHTNHKRFPGRNS